MFGFFKFLQMGISRMGKKYVFRIFLLYFLLLRIFDFLYPVMYYQGFCIFT